MSPEDIRRREASARCFRPGWDVVLADLGLIVRLDCDGQPPIYMVESAACARVIGSTPKTVEKNLEVMRHLKYIGRKRRDAPEMFGFRAARDRLPPTIEGILGVEPLSSAEEDPVAYNMDGELPPVEFDQSDALFELPPVLFDQSEYWLF